VSDGDSRCDDQNSLLSILLTGSMVCIISCLMLGLDFISFSRLFSIKFSSCSSKLRLACAFAFCYNSPMRFCCSWSCCSSYVMRLVSVSTCSTAFLFFYWLSLALSLFLRTHWHFLQLHRSSPLKGHLLNSLVISEA
jgi:hypothetical protein